MNLLVSKAVALRAALVAVMVIGKGDAGAQTPCRSAFVGSWAPSDVQAGDGFGYAVAGNDSLDRVAVSAAGVVQQGHANAGAVWVVMQPNPPTRVVHRIDPSVAFLSLNFGRSMVFDEFGDTLAVGAPRNSAAQPGWVFIYRFDGVKWSEDWRFNSTHQSDLLGASVSMNAAGDLLAVGAPGRTYVVNPIATGAMEIFRREAGGWVHDAVITPFQLPGGNYIGSVVALSRDGRFLATRSPSEVNSTHPNGAVYVLERVAPGSWVQVARLQEPVVHSSSGFGARLCFDATGSVLAAGNWHDSRFFYQQGAVSIFRRTGSNWAYDTVVLPASPVIGGNFGVSVVLNTAGDRMLVGAQGAKLAGVTVGAVEEFECVGGAWRNVAEHYSPEPQQGYTMFGTFVVGGGVTLERWAVGAIRSDTFGVDAGIAHFYEARCLVPRTYCTAQPNTLGCAPRIAAQGAPSASSPAGFTLTARPTRNGQNGVLFFGVNGRAALPWLGGTLCVQPPLRRTPLVNSGGAAPPANDCSGVLSLDFNAWACAANDPALFPGQHVRAQFYSRDPGAPANLNLSDGVEFYFEP